MEKKINLTRLALELVGYNPFVLPKNKYNDKSPTVFKLRALFKLMLFTHFTIKFPRHFDPDLGEYIKQSGNIEYLPVEQTIEGILKYKTGNCGTYSFLFRELAKALGFGERLVQLHSGDRTQGHYVAEIKIEDKWTFFDPMYMNCPSIFHAGKRQLFSAYDIKSNPYIFLDTLMFKGITVETWLKIWECIKINGESTIELSPKVFEEKYYGKI